MEDDYLDDYSATETQLPPDIMYKIPAHISDPASLVRLASSCKFWRDLVKDPAFLDSLRRRHRDHGFTPSLLLGFFYQDKKSKSARNAMKPLSLETFIQDLGASLNFYKPIASQDSFLALRRQSKAADGESIVGSLCVCKFSVSFQLIGIWVIEAKHFHSVCYSSKTRTWSWPEVVPELMPGLYLVSASAAALDGVIHWFCGSWRHMALTHVVTLHVGHMELSYLELPPEAMLNKAPLLASSADGGLLLLFVQGLQMSLWKHSSVPGSDSSVGWTLSERIDMRSSLPPRVLKTGIRPKVRLEMFRGKSGTVVLWLDGEGLFLFSLSDRSLRTIDSEYVTKKYFLCPYEIDWLSCLAITNLVTDGSLSLDVQREKAQGRWRALMGTNLATNTASFNV
ncbi:unnamed protein product [Alopecurus aequalis]